MLNLNILKTKIKCKLDIREDVYNAYNLKNRNVIKLEKTNILHFILCLFLL